MIRDSLDGKNVEAVLLELGTRLHRILYDHLYQFQYNSLGMYSNNGITRTLIAQVKLNFGIYWIQIIGCISEN